MRNRCPPAATHQFSSTRTTPPLRRTRIGRYRAALLLDLGRTRRLPGRTPAEPGIGRTLRLRGIRRSLRRLPPVNPASLLHTSATPIRSRACLRHARSERPGCEPPREVARPRELHSSAFRGARTDSTMRRRRARRCGAGNDQVRGGSGKDAAIGEGGNDVIVGGRSWIMDFEVGVDRIEAPGLTDSNLAARATQSGEHLHIEFEPAGAGPAETEAATSTSPGQRSKPPRDTTCSSECGAMPWPLNPFLHLAKRAVGRAPPFRHGVTTGNTRR